MADGAGTVERTERIVLGVCVAAALAHQEAGVVEERDKTVQQMTETIVKKEKQAKKQDATIKEKNTEIIEKDKRIEQENLWK